MSGHAFNIRNNLWVKGDSVASGIEIGSGAASLPSYIDFHANTGAGDYEARLIRYAGANGNIVLQNIGTGDVLLSTALGEAQAFRMNANGNLGLGAAPSSTWNGSTTAKILQLGTASTLATWNEAGNYQTWLGLNAAFNGNAWSSTTAMSPRLFDIDASGFKFMIAPAAAVGTATTWNTAATLNSAGQFIIGGNASMTGAIKDYSSQTTGFIDKYYKFFVTGGNDNRNVGVTISNSPIDADVGFFRQNAAGDYIRGAVVSSSWSSTVTGAEECSLVFQTKSASSTVGTAERMRINSAGNVAIGGGGGIPLQGRLMLADYTLTGGPYLVFANRGPNTSHTNSYNVGGIEASAYRDVADPAYIAAIHFQRDSYASGLSSMGSIIFKTTNSPQSDKATLTEAMRIDSSQRVQIGVQNSVYNERFVVYGAGTQSAGSFVSPTSGGVLNVIGSGSTYGGGMVLRVGIESRSAANLAVFYTDTMGYVGGSALGVGSITTNGTTSVAYNTTSDYRLKHDVVDLTGSSAFIDALQPREYKWNVDNSKGVGFLAHELQAVSPLSVTGEKDAVDDDGNPVYQVVEYGSAELIAHMVAEMKAMRVRLASLEAEVAALKAK